MKTTINSQRPIIELFIGDFPRRYQQSKVIKSAENLYRFPISIRE